MTAQVLAGKTGVVFGVANKRSIAWAIAKAWATAGARLVFNYQGERLKENVEELVGEFGEKTPLFSCDVSSDEEIKSFFEKVRGETDHVDLMLHSLAFAPKEALEGDFLSTTREAFRTAHDISAYSLVALAREAAPMMANGGGIVAQTSYGSRKDAPHYYTTGVGEASPQHGTTERGTSIAARCDQGAAQRVAGYGVGDGGAGNRRGARWREVGRGVATGSWSRGKMDDRRDEVTEVCVGGTNSGHGTRRRVWLR